MLSYTKLAFCGLLYKPEPKRILVLGLGGGVIPREMHSYFPATDIDVAEIDPDIQQTAKQFFGFREDDKLRVHISDGRMFIKELLRRKSAEKYDIVVLDAFNSEYIPFHLMTKEFLEQVKGVLAEDGVVVANVFQNNRLFDAELATFLAVFGRCQVFVDEYSTNAMLVSPGPNGRTLSVDEAVSQAKTQELGIAFGVGSQRAAIEDPKLAETFKVRSVAPDVFLVGNIGMPQLTQGYGVAEARRAVEMIEADALSIHMNPLQELCSRRENRCTGARVEKFSKVCKGLDLPVIAKETGGGVRRRGCQGTCWSWSFSD